MKTKYLVSSWVLLLLLASCDPNLVGELCKLDADCTDENHVCEFESGRCIAIADVGFGGKVAYVSNRSGAYEVWVMNDDGSGRRQLSFAAEEPMRHWGTNFPRWSRDGNRIAFYYASFTGGEDDAPASRVMQMEADGDDLRELSSDYYANATQLSWSTDGTALWMPIHRSCTDYIDLMGLTTFERETMLDETEDAYLSVRAPDANPQDSDLIVFEAYNCGGDDGGIRLFRLSNQSQSVIEAPGSGAASPRWSSDGSRLLWAGANVNFFSVADSEGTGRQDIQPSVPGEEIVLDKPDWADGGFVFSVSDGTQVSIWICDEDGKRARPILQDQQSNTQVDWAPGRLPPWAEDDCLVHGGHWKADGLGSQGCWFASLLDQSCTEACLDHGLSCDPRNWNDNPACDICSELTNEPKSTANNPGHDNAAPYMYEPSGTSHGCYYRAEDFSQDCDASGGSRIRLCVCRPWE